MGWLFGRRATPAPLGTPRRPPAPASIDLLWEEAHVTSEAQSDRHAALDTKTVPLLAFGLTLGAFLRTAPAAGLLDSMWRDALTGAVVMGLLGTLGAVLPRKWARVPDLALFVQDGNLDPARLKVRYLRNYLNASVYNESVLRRKFVWFRFAVGMYVLALALGAAATIWPNG